MYSRLPLGALVFALAWALVAGACGGGSGLIPGGTATSETAGPVATPAGESRTPPVDTPPANLDEAQALARDGRFEDAAEAYASAASHLDDDDERAVALLGEAVAWFDAGDDERGIVVLQETVAVAPTGTQAWRRSRYLLGTLLQDDGQSNDALSTLGPVYLERYDDPLQPRIDAAYAEAAADSGQSRSASEAWDAALASVHTGHSLEVSIYRARVEDARRRGDAAALAQWLTALTSAASDPGDRYALAGLALAAGDRATFEAQLNTIVLVDPGSAFALLALEWLEAEGFTVDPGDAGYVHYRHRKYAVARELLARALEDPGLSASERSWRLYYLAASYDDAGQAAESIPLYDQAAALDGSGDTAHRAQYWAARAAESSGDTAAAATRYANLAAGPAGEFSGEAAFRAGFVLLDSGDAAGAVATWGAPAVTHDARLLYWLGRAQRDLGNEAAALAAFADASTREPQGFFGMEAARAAGLPPDDDARYAPFIVPPAPDWDALATWLAGGTPTVAPEPAATAAPDLLALGLSSEAATAIAESDAPPLARLRAAYALGLTQVSARLAGEITADRRTSPAETPGDLLRLAYPITYVSLLDAEARLNGIDPLFLAALIRTESAWDHTAVSPAGAIGLTQVIPPTGEALAQERGLPDWRPEHLTRPAISIAFGADYVGGQLERFGNPYQALAAYNGGPGNALTWGAQADPSNPADFVEAITFSETRRYVELVMSSYAMYRALYGSSGPVWP